MVAKMREDAEPAWAEVQESGVAAGHRVILYDSVESTNALALDMGLDGELPEPGTVLCARTQVRGRGRLGKIWVSPPGTGLYFSLILQPELSRRDMARVTLAAGLAVARAIECVAGVTTTIKWPNDVLVNGRKVAGILCECDSWSGGDRLLVVVGVGINVNTGMEDFPEDLRERAASLLSVSGRVTDKGELLAAVLRHLDREILRLEQGEFAELLAEWRSLDATLHRRLSWLAPDGRVVTGISLGPDSEGLLRVRDDSGEVH